MSAFAVRIAGLSASRYNGVMTMLKAAIPAARGVRRRRIVVKDRPLISQLEFTRLLAELDGRPRSHGGLVVRFLSHTGLRIAEARRLTWGDVHEDFILAPSRVTKNGYARVIPFVNGIRDVLAGLRAVGDGKAVLASSGGQTVAGDGVCACGPAAVVASRLSAFVRDAVY